LEFYFYNNELIVHLTTYGSNQVLETNFKLYYILQEVMFVKTIVKKFREYRSAVKFVY